MIALLSSTDSVALVAAERIEETEAFRGVSFVNLGPSHALVYEIAYTLTFADPQYTREAREGLVPGKPHLVKPGDTYRVLDPKVYGSLRESKDSDGAEWLTSGLGELTVRVRYTPGEARVVAATLTIDADEDALRLEVLPADRHLLASIG